MLRQAEDGDWERIRTVPRPARCDVHARGIGMRRMQLIVTPSFEEASVWEVRKLPQDSQWQLVRSREVARFPELMVVGYELVPFASSTLAAYFARVTSIDLPLRPDLSGYGGIDGTTYEFAVYGDLWSGLRVQWWSEWPEAWRPIVEIAAEMHAAFTTAHHPDSELSDG
jgi:hypothetical protein